MKWSNLKFPINSFDAVNHLFGKVIPLAVLVNFVKSETWVLCSFAMIFMLSLLIDLFKKYSDLRAINIEIKSKEKKEKLKNDLLEHLVKGYQINLTRNTANHRELVNLEKIIHLLSDNNENTNAQRLNRNSLQRLKQKDIED